MSFVEATRALVQALKAEGGAGAPWGARVHLRAASEVVEISGDPKKAAWPYLLLRGPALAEETALRAEYARELSEVDEASATVAVRAWPAWYTLSFELRAAARVGHTASAVSAQEELLAMQERITTWARRHRSIGGARVVLSAPPGIAPGAAVDASDVLDAVGRIELQHLKVYPDTPRFVGTSRGAARPDEVVVAVRAALEG